MNPPAGVDILPLRLHPGDDLRRALELAVAARGTWAAFVVAGHAGYDCTVRTTAEVLLALLPDHAFSRQPDAQTGWAEPVIRPRGDHVSRIER